MKIKEDERKWKIKQTTTKKNYGRMYRSRRRMEKKGEGRSMKIKEEERKRKI